MHILHPQKVKRNSQLLGVGHVYLLLSEEWSVRSDEKKTFTVERPDHHDLSQAATVTSDESCWLRTLRMISWKWQFTLGIFLPQTHNPSLARKIYQINPGWGTFYEIPTCTHQNGQGHQN